MGSAAEEGASVLEDLQVYSVAGVAECSNSTHLCQVRTTPLTRTPSATRRFDRNRDPQRHDAAETKSRASTPCMESWLPGLGSVVPGYA
jgi:hypothetical protein